MENGQVIMNILLTNDDGIASAGIRKLAEKLRAAGRHRVFVIAPDSDRSGTSHGIAIIRKPLKLAALEADTWSCSGNPADCVIIACLGGLPVKPDLVLSGINAGANLGTDIVFSGTAAAARQASLFDIPAVALSLCGHKDFEWEAAALWSAENIDELLSYWKKETFVNVNIPNIPRAPEGKALTWLSVRSYNDRLKIIDTSEKIRWCFLDSGGEITKPEEGSDFDAVSRNYVSISPVGIYPAVRKDICAGAPDYAALAPRDVC